MTEQPADIELGESPSPVFATPPPEHRSRPPVWVWAGLVVLLLALGAAYFFLWRGTGEKPVATKPVQAPAPKTESAEQITLPPLDDSDPIVRQLVGKLSSHPAVAAWLTTEGLLLNFTVVTTKIANGDTPVIELKALRPIPRFTTRMSGETRYIDRESYRRYDRFAEAVMALDSRGTARLYTTLKPRITEAYGRMGPSDGNFDAVLERAIFELLSVPVVQGEIALEPHGTVYAFADPKLQSMSAAQKQFLRMGPQNVSNVQAKLREIAAYAGIPETRLPPAKK
jgi:hypothetical protein